MVWLLSLGWAAEVDAALVQRRIAEIAPLRTLRVTEDAPEVPPDFYREAAAGDIPTQLVAVKGHAAKKALGIAVVDVPIGRMWSAVNDESSKVQWTRLSYLEVFRGTNCENGRQVLQYLPMPLVSDRWWVVEQQMNTALMTRSEGQVREVRWRSIDARPTTASATAWMDKGIPLAYTHGSWFLVDLDGAHTLIEYYTWTDPGGSVPAGLASSFAAGGISDTLRTMAELGRTGPNCPIE